MGFDEASQSIAGINPAIAMRYAPNFMVAS